MRRFVLFHGKRHPRDLGIAEVSAFLEFLARSEKDPLVSLEQAHEALTFLYGVVLRVPLAEVLIPEPPRLLDRVRYAARVRHFSPRTEDCYVAWIERYIRFHCLRHPNTMDEVEGGGGMFRLMASLLYGAGLRREECCRLRVHDMDRTRRQVVVRHGKGGKDRVVMLPRALLGDVERQLAWRRQLHERDLAAGPARVALPDALARKYPRAALELGWQFLFASRQRSRDPKTGDIGLPGRLDPGSACRDGVGQPQFLTGPYFQGSPLCSPRRDEL